jgi:hypothetical protein
MGRVTFRAEVTPRLARRFFRASQQVDTIIRRELHGDLAPRLLRVSRQAAPERRGRLARGLRAVPGAGGHSVEVVSTVRSEDGYPYTGVTRLGHRKEWIVPRRKKALRTPWGPRRRVRGYKPAGDWADKAHRLAQPHVSRSAQRIGRQLEAATG